MSEMHERLTVKVIKFLADEHCSIQECIKICGSVLVYCFIHYSKDPIKDMKNLTDALNTQMQVEVDDVAKRTSIARQTAETFDKRLS